MLILSLKKKAFVLLTSRIMFDRVFRSWALHIDIRLSTMFPAMGDGILCNLRTFQSSPLWYSHCEANWSVLNKGGRAQRDRWEWFESGTCLTIPAVLVCAILWPLKLQGSMGGSQSRGGKRWQPCMLTPKAITVPFAG